MEWRTARWANTLAVLAATADSVLAAGSRPFTRGADIATAVGLVGVAVIGLAYRRRPSSPVPATDREGPRPTRAAMIAWGSLAAAVVIFELVNFVARPRSAHPTISSLLDALTSHDLLRGLLFALWLGVGWWLWTGP